MVAMAWAALPRAKRSCHARDDISGWGGIDLHTGSVIESRHELKGVSFAGKISDLPGAKGSSGWTNAFHLEDRARNGAAPPWRSHRDDHQGRRWGAVVISRIPTVTECDADPLGVIRTGDEDWRGVDGGTGDWSKSGKRGAIRPLDVRRRRRSWRRVA